MATTMAMESMGNTVMGKNMVMVMAMVMGEKIKDKQNN